MQTKVMCPNCGHYNSVAVEPRWNTTQLVRCDDDAGGCDRLFVVELTLNIEKKIYRLEEGDKADATTSRG